MDQIAHAVHKINSTRQTKNAEAPVAAKVDHCKLVVPECETFHDALDDLPAPLNAPLHGLQAGTVTNPTVRLKIANCII